MRLGVPADVGTLAGVERLVSERASETQRLDFKRQLHSVDDLADDLSAMANVGGGVVVIGVGTDRTDRAASLHEQNLRTVEQQVVQAARDGIDEPLRLELLLVAGPADHATGFVVVVVPPSDRIPHVSAKRGRVLHRVGTHNKPMTRRELGAAFAAAGDLFALEFGLVRGPAGGTSIVCELLDSTAGMFNTIKVVNRGPVTALDISINSTTSVLLWEKQANVKSFGARLENYAAVLPPYLPIRSLPAGSDVVLSCNRDLSDPTQDVLQVTWRTPDGQAHRNEQSWSWTPRGPRGL